MANTRTSLVTVDHQAVDHLLRYIKEHNLTHFVVVADHNTQRVLGERVVAALRGAGCDVISAFFAEEKPVADAQHIFQVLLQCDTQPRAFIAVGSGTITDITRFVSHRTHAEFLAMPTAPSVDGFTSIGAPLIIDGIKATVICHPPSAIFADLAVLSGAPRALIAAGFGDMLGKFTSIADFRLGHLLWDEPYDEAIAQRTLKAAQLCVDHATEIATASPAAIRILMDALVESGYCMLDFGNSRPASGTEHHYSHYWEMKLMREGRPPILHGAKVGFATILAARLYEQVKALTRADLSDRLEAAPLPPKAQEIAQIEAAYGDLAPEMVVAQRPFLAMTEARFDALKRKILTQWAAIQQLAADVPAAQTVTELLQRVGGPTTGATLGLSDAEVQQGANAAHYLRDRFTVRKLAHYVKLD
ncbi:MAG: sn-glycerol-1-phosphate dehydrogenase [Caldilineaceae bacterium]